MIQIFVCQWLHFIIPHLWTISHHFVDILEPSRKTAILKTCFQTSWNCSDFENISNFCQSLLCAWMQKCWACFLFSIMRVGRVRPLMKTILLSFGIFTCNVCSLLMIFCNIIILANILLQYHRQNEENCCYYSYIFKSRSVRIVWQLQAKRSNLFEKKLKH